MGSRPEIIVVGGGITDSNPFTSGDTRVAAAAPVALRERVRYDPGIDSSS